MDTEEQAVFSSPAEQWMVRGGGLDLVVERRDGFATEEMTLNIGPQHPSTHGVLRVIIELDGEVITRAEPVIGYMHRAAEKLSEVRDPRQVLVLMNRHDWLSAFNNELGWTIAVERLAGIEVPDRAQWIRTMMAEWNRILNHLMFCGSFSLELGAMTPMFYSFCRVGGLKDDLPRGWLKHSADVVKWVSSKLRDFETLILGNEIFAARTRGVGVLSPEAAVSYGASGPELHASGVPMDPRRDSPYEKYGEVEFSIPIGEHGDSYDRLWVLVQRMWESLKIVEQCMEKLPAGAYRASSLPKTIKIDGEIYVRTENPLGLMGYYVIGNGGRSPYRLKMRTASFSNISVLPELLQGQLLPDLIAIMGSVFFVVGDVDR